MKTTLFTAFLTLLVATSSLAGEGMINIESAFGVTETADRLEATLKEKGMTVFNRINHAQGAEKVDIKLRGTELIIFGNPKVGSPLMQCQQSVALDLPQKMLVWQDASSKVWLSYNDPSYLVQRHEINGCEQEIATVAKALAGISHRVATK
ncbi:DUF302 domain-containing protein [Oceanisphaera sp. IT1-181]|uniref:DUF302 domain-containing protein n=1 Tax=Oceanisphaera sp. IT1-181 TaxID=3081199 RepID=UPI0029C9C2F8|nr:DUF302 domain-containing protein [Oceanisphaera sp. IT1-181]